MTEQNEKETAKPSTLAIVFGLGSWIVIFLGLIFGLSKCFSGTDYGILYSNCLTEKQKLGINLIKADVLCAYLRKTNP